MTKQMAHQGAIGILLAAVALLVLTSCSTPTNQPPVIQGNVIVSPATIPVGGRATITAIATDPDGDNVVYYWEAKRGSVPAGAQGDTVVYIAPDTSGIDTVVVTVNDGQEIASQEVKISVIGPTPTDIPTLAFAETPSPTPTPSPLPTHTPTPRATDTPPPSSPIACGPATNPGCLAYVFPQLAEISSAVPFLFTDQPERFTAEYTDEEFHSAPISIKITYDAAHSSYGGWGIGGLPGYDASDFGRVSFYLRGTAIGQTFEFKLKDTALREDTVVVTVETLDWTEVTFALNADNFPTVEFASLENTNLGFNDSFGSTTIYVDDFTFE